MPTPSLSRLEPVELRQVWAGEASDFTPWLAQPDNLALLGETLGLDLELEAQEQPVGAYRADLLCKDTATDRRVLIENQLETTDHSHLGQILTYAAGLDAAIIIWVSPEFNEEHRAALDWLNEKTSGAVSFFGVKVALYRVSGSPPAPQFTLVSTPNDWAIHVKESATRAELTATDSLHLEYWTAFCRVLQASGAPFRCNTVSAKRYLAVRAPKNGTRAGFEVSVTHRYIQAYFGGASEDTLQQILNFTAEQKAAIERDCGCAIEWPQEPESDHCWINASKEADPNDRNAWPAQHTWMIETLKKLVPAVIHQLR